MLSSEERTRYARHLLLPQVGIEGQQKLKEASVLIVGAGGLGSPVALYLVAAGVGRIGLVDFDQVDASNLQRQILYGTSDVGRSKLDAATDRLADLNPHVRIETHPHRLTSDNAMEIVAGYDLVADGTDNFATRYLVNDACVLSGKPNVYASIFRFDGQVSVFGAPEGPCYRCLFPEPPPPGAVPSCAEGGVLGVLPGIVGTLQAAEVIKMIGGIGDPLVGRLLLADVEEMTFRTLRVERNPDCPVCGNQPGITSLIDYEAFCSGRPASAAQNQTAAPPSNRPQTNMPMFSGSSVPSISVSELKQKLDASDDLLLLDVRRPEELAISDIGGTVIPLDELASRMDELESWRDKEVVVMCRSGSRSSNVVGFLRKEGFERAVNLDGGILAWSREIDPSVPRY